MSNNTFVRTIPLKKRYENMKRLERLNERGKRKKQQKEFSFRNKDSYVHRMLVKPFKAEKKGIIGGKQMYKCYFLLNKTQWNSVKETKKLGPVMFTYSK